MPEEPSMSEFDGSPAMTQDDALRPGAGGQFADGSVASAGSLIRQARETVSYTHLTLPTKRIV